MYSITPVPLRIGLVVDPYECNGTCNAITMTFISFLIRTIFIFSELIRFDSMFFCWWLDVKPIIIDWKYTVFCFAKHTEFFNAHCSSIHLVDWIMRKTCFEFKFWFIFLREFSNANVGFWPQKWSDFYRIESTICH